MRTAVRRAGPAAFCGLLLCGCASKPPAPALTPIRSDQWKQELAALRGQVVVVDVWATWCAPCLERFPHIVELNRQYRDRHVTVISMNVDDREDHKAVEMARQFLVKQKAAFRNYLMDEPILDSFQELGVQGIPAVFIYDRTGRQRYFLNADDPNHQFTSADVDDAVASLVSEPARTS
jgi:thiol-disulfide isomerase/thioredoxin